MTCEPCATAAALWLQAWLAGQADSDATVTALTRALPDCAPVQLLADLREAGADQVWLLLPRPGATLGWPRCAPVGPEPAVLASRAGASCALIPAGAGRQRMVAVTGEPTLPLAASAMGPRAVERALGQLVIEAARRLEALDLARSPGRPGSTRWARALVPTPPGLPSAAVATLDRATTILDALELAMTDEGAANTAGEAAARSLRLRELRDGVHDLLVALVAGLGAQAAPATARPAAASLR